MSAAAKVSPDRRAMLAKVHMGAVDLGLQDDARRDILERITGHRSSAACTDAQLGDVLAEYRRLGWQARPAAPRASPPPRLSPAPRPAPQRPAPATNPVALKARAIWLSLWNLGVVRHGTEAALEAFAKRQLRVDRLHWADQSQGYRLIEALKAMAERAGWSQDLHLVRADKHLHALKSRLVQRQAEILGRAPLQLHGLDLRALDKLAADMGREIRATREPAEG